MSWPIFKIGKKLSDNVSFFQCIAGSAEHAHVNTKRSQNTLYNASDRQKSRRFTVCTESLKDIAERQPNYHEDLNIAPPYPLVE